MRFVESSGVGFVIPTHNDLHHLRKTLGLLRGMSYEESIVLVVDDGSHDGTREFLASLDDVVVVEGHGSLWWSGAINVGGFELIGRGADVVVMWNDDNVAASPDCLDELVRHVRTTGDCVSPVLIQRSVNGNVTVRHRGGSVDWSGGGVGLRDYGEPFSASDTIDRVPWLPGSALAVAAECFVRVGGVDDKRFPQYRGDADFTMRAIEQGADCAVLNWCWVENDAGRTGVHPGRRTGPRGFIRGLTSTRSSDQLRSTIPFMLRHCPSRPLAAWCLAVYYMKYIYWCLKTWR